MSACCGRRPNDGTIDRENIDRAMAGRPATISPDEFRIIVMRLNRERGWGLTRISGSMNYASRSTVAEILASLRGRP